MTGKQEAQGEASPICDAAAATGSEDVAAAVPAAVAAVDEPAAEAPPEGAAERGDVVADDLAELAQLTAQRDEYLALAQRTQADFDNYRKRVAREAASATARGTANLARELLPALDNLDRALDAVAGESGQLVDGMRLVRSELQGALGRAGIEAFEPAGEAFDPELHEAVAQQPVEGAQSGTVVEVYQAGYRLTGGALIRPARVMVAG